jgi:hypothetical protein
MTVRTVPSDTALLLRRSWPKRGLSSGFSDEKLRGYNTRVRLATRNGTIRTFRFCDCVIPGSS